MTAALDDDVSPTRIFYAIRSASTATATNAINRICVINLDASGQPTGVPEVFAGPATGIAPAASVDDANRLNAQFEAISAIAYEPSTGLLYVLQRVNSTNPNQLIRVISTAP